jgi:hypothetical protein
VLGLGLGSDVVVSLPPYAESRVLDDVREDCPLLLSLWNGFDSLHLDFFSFGSLAGAVTDADISLSGSKRDSTKDYNMRICECDKLGLERTVRR